MCQHQLLPNIIFKQWTLSPKLNTKPSYKHPLFKSTSTVHNIQSCVKSTQLLTQEFQVTVHIFSKTEQIQTAKKNAFCYTFNVRTTISTKIMKEHTESTVRRGHSDAPHFG